MAGKSTALTGAAIVIAMLAFAAPASAGTTNQPPTVTVIAAPTTGVAPMTVLLSAATSDSDSLTFSYDWDLNGDGVFGDAHSQDIVYTYLVPGTYTASVRVTDDAGATGTDTQTINVLSPGPTSKAQCKNGGWKSFGTFKNQGKCVELFET